MKAFDRKNLEGALQKLTVMHRLAFAASCCNRVLPSYAAFSRQQQWGDYDVLESAVTYIWECLEEGSKPSDDRAKMLLSECEAATPDLDEVFEATLGHDAALVVRHALRCAQNGSAEDAAYAASWAYEGMDTFVFEHGGMNLDAADPRLTEKIAAHQLVQRELLQQEADLDFLSVHSELSTAAVIQLRHSWQNHGKSNVNLS